MTHKAQAVPGRRTSWTWDSSKSFVFVAADMPSLRYPLGHMAMGGNRNLSVNEPDSKVYYPNKSRCRNQHEIFMLLQISYDKGTYYEVIFIGICPQAV